MFPEYYGFDWIANLFFFIYLIYLPTNPKPAMLCSVVGCISQVIFSIMAYSVGNAICTAIFCLMYFRAWLILKKAGDFSKAS